MADRNKVWANALSLGDSGEAAAGAGLVGRGDSEAEIEGAK